MKTYIQRGKVDVYITYEAVSYTHLDVYKRQIVIPNGCEKEKAFEIAKADERIASFLEGKNLIKEIYVPNKIVKMCIRDRFNRSSCSLGSHICAEIIQHDFCMISGKYRFSNAGDPICIHTSQKHAGFYLCGSNR